MVVRRKTRIALNCQYERFSSSCTIPAVDGEGSDQTTIASFCQPMGERDDLKRLKGHVLKEMRKIKREICSTAQSCRQECRISCSVKGGEQTKTQQAWNTSAMQASACCTTKNLLSCLFLFCQGSFNCCKTLYFCCYNQSDVFWNRVKARRCRNVSRDYLVLIHDWMRREKEEWAKKFGASEFR